MSSYYGYPTQNAQFASYMAAAAAASQSGIPAAAPPQAYQVAYPAPNQYNPQYTAMYSAAPIKTVTVVTSTSAVKPVQRAQSLYSNFVQAGQSAPVPGNGYDAAVLSAATSYSGSSGHESNPYANYGYGAPTVSSGPVRSGNSSRRPSFWGKRTQTQPGNRASVYYCECCKVTCAGPQTWQEHVAGSKHKKKDAALQSGKDAGCPPVKSGSSFLKCAVCEITVTGSDAFVAHVNGAKHQKTLKVYQQMGKPIPSSEPLLITPAQNTTIISDKKGGLAKKLPNIQGKGGTVLGTARVAFVGGTLLSTTGSTTATPVPSSTTPTSSSPADAPTGIMEIEPLLKVEADSNCGSAQTSSMTISQAQPRQSTTGILYLPNERDVAPVGGEYVEDIFGDAGKLVSYKCKLCDCSFNDVYAKDMHLKGRRHRLAYKQKVDPSLVVEMKSNAYKRGSRNGPAGNNNGRYFNAAKGGQISGGNGGTSRGNIDPYFVPPSAPRLRPLLSRQSNFGTTELDDRYVATKHATVYASQMELQAIQKLVLSCEGALKMTSDQLLEEEVAKERQIQESNTNSNEQSNEPKPQWTPSQQQVQQMRHLRGVQRCGPLAKGLLIRGDDSVDLVVMCLEKPTVSLLEKVASLLPGYFSPTKSSSNGDESSLHEVELGDFEVATASEEAIITVSTCARFPADPSSDDLSLSQESKRNFKCRVFFTSQAFGDDTDAATDPSDMLPRSRCLDALAELRHAKWFQAKLSPNTEGMVALRILRDLSRRVPTWKPFPQWALELLIERCAATAVVPSNASGAPSLVVSLTAAQLLRRVFECLAAGLLLPGGPGIWDPCERDPTDAASSLSEQQREDITASAQHALRLVAFGLIWKVLGIDRIPSPSLNRKSSHSNLKRKATDDPSQIESKVPTSEPTAMVLC